MKKADSILIKTGNENAFMDFEETNGEVEKATIHNPRALPDNSLRTIIDHQIDSITPKQITIYHSSGIRECPPRTFEEVRSLPIGQQNAFIQDLVDEMRVAKAVSIESPNYNPHAR